MITMDEVRILDMNSEFHGVPPGLLMDHAGGIVAEKLLENTDIRDGIVVLVGRGNNGGDGLVAARALLGSVDHIKVLAFFPPDGPGSPLARKAFAALSEDGRAEFVHIGKERAAIQLKAHLSSARVVVDAMLGAGLKGTPRAPFSDALEIMGALDPRPFILAVDAPSGLGTPVTIVPDLTVTFHDTKPGMGPESCGKLVVGDIGIPPMAVDHVGPGDLLRYPVPVQGAHKGMGGRVMVIGGGPYIGAPIMAGLGALRAGVDLLYLSAPRAIAFRPSFDTYSFIPVPFSNTEDWHFLDTPHVKGILESIAANHMDTVVMGCGLGDEKNTQEAVLRIIEGMDRGVSLVVDADGMKALGGNIDRAVKAFTGRKVVLTPHINEARELLRNTPLSPKLPVLDEEDVRKKAEFLPELARYLHATLLLKGPTDLITNGKKVRYNSTGVPRMAVGGTGDVLAGVVGGLLAKGMTTFHAASLAAFLNGYFGQRTFARKGWSMVSTDILDEFAITGDLAERIVREGG